MPQVEGICNQDGYCDVYEQTEYGNRRRRNTQWCSCTASMCIISCPNFLVCGRRDPKWVHDCHSGRCVNCNILLGKNLTFLTGTMTECIICMNPSPETLVEWPTCQHAYCIECTQKMHFGTRTGVEFCKKGQRQKVEPERTEEESADEADYWEEVRKKEEAEEDEEEDEEEEEEGDTMTNGCPLCRKSK
jgi:hypothetical protein